MDKGIFIGIFEKSDKIIRFWSIFQAPFIVIFYLLLPVCFLECLKSHSVGPISWAIHSCIVIILSLIGLKKSWTMYRLFQKAKNIMVRHKNKDLSNMFEKMPRILFASFVLDVLLPFTWPVSFMVKFLFYKNLVNIKFLMYTREKEE